MITVAHAILDGTDADADRVFLRDLLGTRTGDAGGWLILALPPDKVAVHPTLAAPAHDGCSTSPPPRWTAAPPSSGHADRVS